ncbi:MAG: hypothetical protein ABI388_01725 [Bacteroidia bacterium]
MKKILFIALLSSSFLMVNAQANNEFVKSETLNCRTEQQSNLTLDEKENKFIAESMEAKSDVTETKSGTKNKIHFIKRILSNFRGGDIKDAWSLLSSN